MTKTSRIHIVLAVYKPDPEYFAQQIHSIGNQTDRDLKLWCVAADCTSEGLIRAICGSQAPGIPVEVLSPESALGAVQAFEFGLTRALAASQDGDLFALSDQDDVWRADKMALSRARLAQAHVDMVHSDARVVDAAGAERHASIFQLEGRVKAPRLRDLLYLNNVTGMTAVCTRRVLQLALPFPPQNGVHFYHDLWLALVAKLFSPVTLIDAPLVDYRQHGGNVIGAIEGGADQPKAFSRPWIRDKVASYALAQYLAKSLYYRAEELAMMEGNALDRRALDTLRPFLSQYRPGFSFYADGLGLLARGKGVQGRKALGYGLVKTARLGWALKRSLSRSAVLSNLEVFDHKAYSFSPGVLPMAGHSKPDPAEAHVGRSWEEMRYQNRLLHWRPTFDAPTPGVVVLIPTLNPSEIFAGIATALDFGVGLAKRGIPVRFVACNLPIASLQASTEFIRSRCKGDDGPETLARISLHCGVVQETISLHREDLFFATAWWTAHVADTLIQTYGRPGQRFYYLLQDYEPNFYPWGDEFAGAATSYDLDFVPIFNTTLLRDYYAQVGHGFARDAEMVFCPSIPVERYSGARRALRPKGGRRKIAVYGRPEVARNMFPTSVEALGLFLAAEGLTPADVELISVGLRHDPIRMPNDLVLASLGKLPWEAYPGFLASVDIGLSLMYSPHPSHPPLEMAAAGAQVVTNHFATKDLSMMSPLIASVEPTPQALAEALSAAWSNPQPVTPEARALDLLKLGREVEETIAQLATHVQATWAKAGVDPKTGPAAMPRIPAAPRGGAGSPEHTDTNTNTDTDTDTDTGTNTRTGTGRGAASGASPDGSGPAAGEAVQEERLE